MNDAIRAREVRVIDADGEQLGIMNVRDALRLAEERELDLVEVAPLLNHQSAASWTMVSTGMNRASAKTCPQETEGYYG